MDEARGSGRIAETNKSGTSSNARRQDFQNKKQEISIQVEDSKALQDDLLDQLIDHDLKEIQMARENQKE